MTLALMLATVKIAEGEVSTVYTPLQPQQLNDHFFSQENASMFTGNKSSTSRESEVRSIVEYYAQKYEVSAQEMMVTLKCESGYRHEGVYGDSGLAYGIAQFHEATFNSFKKTAGMPELEYKNMNDQIHLMAWAFGQGEKLKRHWTCYTKNYGK